MPEIEEATSAPTGIRYAMLAILGAFLLLGAPEQGQATGAVAGALESQAALRTALIPVEGMSCISCAATVKSAVKSLAGVNSVEVSLANRGARVTYAPDKITPQQIAAAIDKVGYKAGTPSEQSR